MGPRYVLVYVLKNHKLAKNSTTTKAKEKISTDLESLEVSNFFDVCLNKFKNNQILFHKLILRFLLTRKLFTGREILINLYGLT
jgi:hypothetical protein